MLWWYFVGPINFRLFFLFSVDGGDADVGLGL